MLAAISLRISARPKVRISGVSSTAPVTASTPHSWYLESFDILTCHSELRNPGRQPKANQIPTKTGAEMSPHYAKNAASSQILRVDMLVSLVRRRIPQF
jgi:hypothetical protein